MIEILYGLISGASFSTSSVIIKRLSEFKPAYMLNFYRSIIGSLCFGIHFLIAGDKAELNRIPLLIILFLVLSVVFNVVLGDTAYFRSQELVGVKTATPIVNTFPFVAIILGYIFLQEELSIEYLFGTVIIISGIILITQKSSSDEITEANKKIGIFLALITTVFYAAGILFTDIGTSDLSPISANIIRLPAASLLLMIYMTPIYKKPKESSEYKKVDFKFYYLMLTAGVLGTYISSYFLVLSTKAVGTGMTALMASLGPIFALPLAHFWLKEQLGSKIVIGTMLTLIGLYVVIS